MFTNVLSTNNWLLLCFMIKSSYPNESKALRDTSQIKTLNGVKSLCTHMEDKTKEIDHVTNASK